MNFIDKCNDMCTHVVKRAVILDEDCKHVGTILVRYTADAEVGWNHQSGVVLHDSTTDLNLDYRTTVKGDTYEPFTLHKLFRPFGVECYDSQGRVIDPKSAETYCSQKALSSLKFKNSVFKVVWA